MDTAGQIPQRAVNLAVAGQPAQGGKGLGPDQHGKVAFAASVVATMPRMFGAVIVHLQPDRGESGLKSLTNFDFNRHFAP